MSSLFFVVPAVRLSAGLPHLQSRSGGEVGITDLEVELRIIDAQSRNSPFTFSRNCSCTKPIYTRTLFHNRLMPIGLVTALLYLIVISATELVKMCFKHNIQEVLVHHISQRTRTTGVRPQNYLEPQRRHSTLKCA